MKKPSNDPCGFKLFCSLCVEFPDKVHKSSNLGCKGFSGTEEGFKSENFARHVEERGHVRAVQLSQKKYGNVATPGPINKYTNQLTKELSEQLKAKFTACNLVCTEGLATTKITPILDSYESLGSDGIKIQVHKLSSHHQY